MKTFKLIFITLLSMFVFSGNVKADNIEFYKAYQYSQKAYYDSYWDAWTQVNILISFNYTTDKITIYSKRIQVYSIYNYDIYYDNDGEKVLRFYFIDQDYDKGTLRLMVRPNGTSQIYVDFSNITWVYNVVKNNR